MKTKTLLAGVSALGLAVALTPVASANETVGDTGQLGLVQVDGYFFSSGEFTVVRSGLSTQGYANSTKNVLQDDTFQTFCIERTESSEGAAHYRVESFADLGGEPAGDPLSAGAAWIYCQFATGDLEGYDYTPGDGRVASARKLQQAFWMLEDDLAPVDSNQFYALAVAQFGGAAGAHADNKVGGFGVHVLQTYADEQLTVRRQDVLHYCPRVPDGGATVMLLGLALSGLGLARRFLGSKA